MTKDHEQVESLLKSVAGMPDAVKVERSVDEMGVLIRAYFDKKDMPRIVGTGGQNAFALKTVIRMIGYTHNLKIELAIKEPKAEGAK